MEYAKSLAAPPNNNAEYSKFSTYCSSLTSTLLRLKQRSSLSISWRPPISRPCFQRILAISTNDFKVGTNIEYDGAPWRVQGVVKDVKQYTYKDGEQYVFMDMATFEESRLNESDLGDRKKWLIEGMDCNVLSWNGRVIDVDLPITVKFKVVDTEPGVKGDTAQGGSKPATIDTGATVNVPFFVNIGDEILVDTRTGTYMSRA